MYLTYAGSSADFSANPPALHVMEVISKSYHTIVLQEKSLIDNNIPLYRKKKNSKKQTNICGRP